MSARRSKKERMLWEQAVRVLRQNSVIGTTTIELPEAKRLLKKVRERAASRRREA